MVEEFNKAKKTKIDWLCDNHKCEFRNLKLVYVCEMCGTKHDPAMDEEITSSAALVAGGSGGNPNANFFRRRARRAQKQKLEDLANAITNIIKIDEGLAARDASKITEIMGESPNNPNVQTKGSAAMGSLTLDSRTSEVIQLDGLRLVIEAMDRFQDNVFVQRAASKLLLNICLAKDGVEGMRTAYKAGVIPAIVTAMTDFPYDSILQWTGTQIFMRLCFVDDDFGRMIWRTGGLQRLQKVWGLRKRWSVQKVFRSQLAASIAHIQSFAQGGIRHDGSDRSAATSAKSLESTASFAFSTDTDDDEAEEGRASSAAKLRQELERQVTAEDLAELSEDEDEMLIDQKIRGNITNLLTRKGWRVGRHPFVPECMDNLFSNSDKEFDLHRLDDMTKLYVPSRGSSRAGGSRGSVSRGSVSSGGAGTSRQSSPQKTSRETAQSRAETAESTRTLTPFFEPVNVDLREDQRPLTKDRPVKWNENAGMYVLSSGSSGSRGRNKSSPPSGFSGSILAKKWLSLSLGNDSANGEGAAGGAATSTQNAVVLSREGVSSRRKSIDFDGRRSSPSPQKVLASTETGPENAARQKDISGDIVTYSDEKEDRRHSTPHVAAAPNAAVGTPQTPPQSPEEDSLSNILVLPRPASQLADSRASSPTKSAPFNVPPPRSALRRKSSFNTSSAAYSHDGSVRHSSPSGRPQSKVSFRLPMGVDGEEADADAPNFPYNDNREGGYVSGRSYSVASSSSPPKSPDPLYPSSPLKPHDALLSTNLNSAGQRIVFTPIGYNEFPLGPVSRGFSPKSMSYSRGHEMMLSRGSLSTPQTAPGKEFALPILPWDD